MNLYNIDNTIKKIIEQGYVFDEETGEISFTSDDLESLEMQLEDKVNNIIGYIKDLNIQADNMKAIKDDYAKRQKTYETKAENLKKYLDGFMQRNEKNKVETDNGIASYRKSKSVDIYDNTALSAWLHDNQEYANIKIEPSKTKIAEAINAKIIVPGAVIKENNNLQIK